MGGCSDDRDVKEKGPSVARSCSLAALIGSRLHEEDFVSDINNNIKMCGRHQCERGLFIVDE